MKQSDLFHPRIFSDQEWAEGYYKPNEKNIGRVEKLRLIEIYGVDSIMYLKNLSKKPIYYRNLL